MSNTFQINSLSFRYAREFFNDAWQNERSLEVSLGRYFLSKFNNVLEVGAVLPYYGSDLHEIIDLADEHPKSRKVNALGYPYAGRNVLSISTIEHMSSREYGNTSDQDSIEFLKQVVAGASTYMITWGIGYNPQLDAYVKAHPEIPRIIMRRTNWKNEWSNHLDTNDFSFPFGHSDKPIPQGFFNNANAVCVITNIPEFLAKDDRFFNHFKNSINDRDKIFKHIITGFDRKPVNILEIGCARSLAPESKGGDGWSSLFWAEYIAEFGGSLTIVDIDANNLNNCKTLLSKFANQNIKFIVGDGLNYINDTYGLIYLDGSDDPVEMVNQFNRIDRKKTTILCDDFHSKGSSLRHVHPNFQSLMANHSHEMALYPKT